MGNRLNFLFRKFMAVLAIMIAGVGVTPLAAQTLPPPSAFAATPGDGAVSLNWAPQPAATVYHLYRNLLDSPTPTPTGTLTPGPPATPTPVITVSALATPAFVDGQVTNGRTYQYSLVGVNASGEGASAVATAVPFSPPAIIQSVQIANTFSNALNISWGIPLS